MIEHRSIDEKMLGMGLSMTRVIGATEARVHFGELLRRVTENDETVVVERGGKPRVAGRSLDEYERLRGAKEPEADWWELAERSRQRIHAYRGGRPLPDIEQMIRDMRDERDAQLLEALR